jgi:hypothetical protein
MEVMLGNFLYSCLYLKLAKMLCLLYYSLCFLFNKIGEEVLPRIEGGGGKELWVGGGVMAQTMYIHMNKRRNNNK